MGYNQAFVPGAFAQQVSPLAEFIVGNSLRKLARKHSWLRSALWRIDYVMISAMIFLFKLLPVDTASRLGERVGSWIGPRLRRKHEIFRDNMSIAFPHLTDEELELLVTHAWGKAGRVLAEYPHLETILHDDKRLDIVVLEPVETYSNPDKPCVMVAPHLSNWEVIASAMARMGIPNASLYSPPTNPLLDEKLLASRRALDCELLPRDNSSRLLLRALKQGRTAAMVMDRRVDEGKAVRFFGQDKHSTTIPARLALKFNCALVPARVQRLQDAHFRVTLYPPVQPGDASASESDQAVDMIQQVHSLFEDWITEQPADWFCSKRLWPKGKLQHNEAAGDAVDSRAA
tara:strand:+ start:68651 stop:69685 length:1035 start_codon:yes stop_codon:yes gene_type:complete